MRHVDVGDGVALVDGAVVRITRDQAAVGCLLLRGAAVAVAHDVLDRRAGDRVFNLDLPPVQGDVQAGDEARAPHQAQRLAGRGFRLQLAGTPCAAHCAATAPVRRTAGDEQGSM
ncbi:hypothetical protein G6F68_017894 [Rhizopus microsporus]|nr:hypothetical protein G6F68_017894 [Rhizopus microsporus]